MSDLPDRKNAERVKVGMNTDGAIFVKTPESLGQNGNDSGERILPGIPENIKLSLLKIRDQNLDQKDNSSLRKFWEMLNDENLLPPKGKRLLPNPETLLTEGVEVSKILFLAFAILNSGVDIANADKIQNDQIAWAIEATQNIDIINAFANKVVPIENRKPREQDQEFTTEEINLISWNIFHEARNKSEGTEGRLGVMLSVLERMKSKNYGTTANEVIFQHAQFTWTSNVEKLKNENNKEVLTFIEIKNLVEKYLKNQNTLDQKIESIRNAIISEYNSKDRFEGEIKKPKITKLPENLTHYQVHKVLENKNFQHESKSDSTKARISYTEKLYLEDLQNVTPRVIKLGTQIYYSEAIANRPSFKSEIAKK
jgi:ribosomal protein S13